MQERDIAKDREMLELTLEVFEDEAVAEEGHDFAATVTGCASLALDYLTRTEHLERKVDAAITELVETLCPHTRKFNTHECDWWRIKPTSVASCHKCINDYLDQKAKEAK